MASLATMRPNGVEPVGKLVRFEKRRVEQKSRAPKQGGAEIVMFTGVRYQRDTTTEPGKPSAPTGPKRKRG